MTSELADLEHQIDLANKLDFHGLPGETKAESLVAISRMRNKLAALDAAAITAFEATHEQRVQGHASVIGWFGHNCHEQIDEATLRRRLANRLLHHPLAEVALRNGDITARHIDVLDKARRHTDDDTYREHEARLLDAAIRRRFCDFELIVTYYIHRNRPHDAGEREKQQIRDRWAHASRTFEGCGAIDAWMPPLDFTLWNGEFQRLVDHLYAADVAEARERLGRAPLPSELQRTNPQRRSDAMLLMAERSAAFDGDLGPSRLVINLHNDTELMTKILEVLHEALNTDDDEDFDLTEAVDAIELGPDSLHETDDGVVVTVNTIVLALLTGTIRGFLHDPDGVPLRYGRERRLFTKSQADALRARFRRCCHPFGCDRTGPRLQSNHNPEWQRNGRTDVDEADTRCGPHNRWFTNTFGQPLPTGPIDDDQRRTPPDTGPLP